MSGRKKYLTADEVAACLKITIRTVYRYRKEGYFPNATKHKRRIRIPRDDINNFRRRMQARIRGRKRVAALSKLNILKSVETDVLQAPFGLSLVYARKLACKKWGISVATFYRWIKRYDQTGLQGLVDTRGNSSVKKLKII